MNSKFTTSKHIDSCRQQTNSLTGVIIEAKRVGLASLLFSILRPRQAKAVSVNSETVELKFGSRTVDFSLGDIEAVSVSNGQRWSSIRIRHVAGTYEVSGLPQKVTSTLVEALESARIHWWRDKLAPQIEFLRFIGERLAKFVDPPHYVTHDMLDDLKRDAQIAVGGLPKQWPKALSDIPEIQLFQDVLEFLEAPDIARETANKAYIKNELVRSGILFDTVESFPLTDEQRKAIVIDERSNLVVAAAGSGKTSVIVAKAAWLIQRMDRKPSELLLLCFARDARNEMQERIRNRLKTTAARCVKVATFHSLGMAIVGEVEAKRPALATTAEDSWALLKQIHGIIADLLAEREISEDLIEWFESGFAPYKSPHEFENWGGYHDYIRKYDIRSLKGELLRSFEECEIANFLFFNGIRYEYEASYKHDLSTATKRQYKPDFYLPEHGIYIEHFGVDAEGKTAPFIDQEEYLQDMEWKREVHKQNSTILIETFSYEHTNGRLLYNLTEKLADHGVTLSPIAAENMFSVLVQQGCIKPFTKLVATFLHHFKDSRLSFSELLERAAGHSDRIRAQAFLAVFRPIAERYQKELTDAGEIDFHDMINRASDLVEAGRYSSPYRYILVDEFQDISPSRARLLKALLETHKSTKLFAVGDDWQSIFRFGGADIAVMREFGNQFGVFERNDLETTFRCSDGICKVATDFILRNPAQINKAVHAKNSSNAPAVYVGLSSPREHTLLNEALKRIASDADKYDEPSEVLLLSRYRHQKPGNIRHLNRQYFGLRITWKTVHSAKGLEADYTVVIGVCSGKYGFPSEMVDDPLIDLVLSAPERFPNAEERRLFYVAITRAKRQAYVLADEGPPSEFISELIDGGYDISVFGKPPTAVVSCPKCIKGQLERKKYSRGNNYFYGCTNFPLCDYTSKSCPSCKVGLPLSSEGLIRCRDCGSLLDNCPVCEGWLEMRMGRYGRFLGCSNWPSCEYTRNPQQKQTNKRKPSKRKKYKRPRRS